MSNTNTVTRIATREGVGLVVKQTPITGTTLGTEVTIGGVISASGGGFTRAMLNDTDLSNTGVMTKVGAALKESKDVTLTLKANGVNAIDDKKSKWVITTGGATLTFYGYATDVEWLKEENGNPAEVSVTITPCNLSEAGVETAPTLVFA